MAWLQHSEPNTKSLRSFFYNFPQHLVSIASLPPIFISLFPSWPTDWMLKFEPPENTYRLEQKLCLIPSLFHSQVDISEPSKYEYSVLTFSGLSEKSWVHMLRISLSE